MSAGLVITAPGSGTGKTTVTMGLLGALHQRGLKVQPFKCGPDYIDPAFHTAVVKRPSFNLDSWSMTAESIRYITRNTGSTRDIAIAEGAMGLFDGAVANGAYGNGAAADISAATGWPVVLVLDVSSQAQSAAAVAHGFASYREDVPVAGVILNKVASDRHERLVKQGLAAKDITVLGTLPRNSAVSLPRRHLGLVQADELPELPAQLQELGEMTTRCCDIDAMLQLAGDAAGQQAPCAASANQASVPPGQHISIARDEAFSFIYPHLLNAWQSAGASVSFFSPLADESPDAQADVCLLPGGYPELHAERLTNARQFRAGILDFAQSRSIHGECGGYMVMGKGLVDADGKRHEMLGLLGLETSFETRQRHLGYRHAQLLQNIPGHSAGAILRGHEFHYSTLLSQPDEPLAQVTDPAGDPVSETGAWRRGPGGNTMSGSYFHYLASDRHQ
ncbi:MAG: cobyrinate a,c-diamide synthase [Pseudomonadota bacterium]